MVTTSYFVGTKIDVFKGSGRGDFQASKDLEDIITVIDGRPTVLEEVRESADDVRTAMRLAPSSPTDSFSMASPTTLHQTRSGRGFRASWKR